MKKKWKLNLEKKSAIKKTKFKSIQKNPCERKNPIFRLIQLKLFQQKKKTPLRIKL